MKVLHVTYSDLGGGGSTVFVQNLQAQLIKKGVDSRILYREKVPEDHTNILFPEVKVVDRVVRKVMTTLGLNNLATLNTFTLPSKEYFKEADVVHFHSLHSDNFNYLALPRVTKAKPAVWTFHDVWAMTGHCSMNFECGRWKTGCGKCPHPEVWPAIKRDATAFEWKLKKRTYSRSRVTIAAPSEWMLGMVKESICKDLPSRCIPNGIDADVFKPIDKVLARREIGIPPDKKVLMAASVKMDEYRKGGDLLKEALERLPASLKKDLLLLTMGNGGKELHKDTGVEGSHMGYLHSNASKAVCYSAADLFVLPTRADNAPLVLVESMACGTPAVSFRVGGVPEFVRDGVTGFIAEPGDAADLSNKIAKFFNEPSLSGPMGARARKMVLEEYSLDLMTRRYMDLYGKVIDGFGR